MYRNSDKTNEKLCSLARKFIRRVRAISPETGCVVALSYAHIEEDMDDGANVAFGPIAESAGGTPWSLIAALMGAICTAAETLSHPALNGEGPCITGSMDSVTQWAQVVAGCLMGYAHGNFDQHTALGLATIASGITKALGAVDDADDADDTDEEEQ